MFRRLSLWIIFCLLTGSVLIMASVGLGRVLPTRQLVYVASQGNHADLILLDLYHRISIKLTDEAYTPAWSPDGERIAFYAIQNDTRELYIMDVYSQHIRQLTHNRSHNDSPSFSPDGREIAFASDYGGRFGIFSMPVDCTDIFERCATRLTPADDFWYGAPAWSPDGSQIVFVTTRDTINAFDHSLGNANLYIMTRDGGGLRRLTDNLGEDYTPAWSPDSRHLVYAAQNIKLGTMELMTLDTRCKEISPCTRLLFSDVIDLMPSWSSDGGSLVFIDARHGSYEIVVTDAEGRYTQRLTYNQIDESSPRWRP